ncbi:hypothetical protein BSKO_01508 [Bryopsis sp. KO-2023]|nr:hypothetical protein BSKO_01508 [Bryopsis sp. KO-2023]
MAANEPEEFLVADASNPEYQEFRKQTDLREPYRLPREILKGIKPKDVYDVSESPLIAFINPRSGGRAGPELVKKLFLALGHAQVYDLGDKKLHPHKVLELLWKNVDELAKRNDPRAGYIKPRLKIAACGGDGTVAWVMKAVQELNLSPPPAVSIIPLGTGNDLSRTFKWGRTFKPKYIKNTQAVYKHLKEMADGYLRDLDCWQLQVTAPDQSYFAEVPGHMLAETSNPNVRSGLSWNYFSIGMDAKSAYGFHHLRDSRPWLASGRMINQVLYAYKSCTSGWFFPSAKFSPPLRDTLSLSVLPTKSDDWVNTKIPPNVKALVMINLQSYGGGRNLWGGKLSAHDKDRGMHDPAFDDGEFEVIGLKSGWHTALVMAGVLHGVRIAQCRGARLELKARQQTPDGNPETVYMQLDGEPWKQFIPSKKEEAPLTVEMMFKSKSLLIMNKRKMKQSDYPPDRSKAPEALKDTRPIGSQEVELVVPAAQS